MLIFLSFIIMLSINTCPYSREICYCKRVIIRTFALRNIPKKANHFSMKLQISGACNRKEGGEIFYSHQRQIDNYYNKKDYHWLDCLENQVIPINAFISGIKILLSVAANNILPDR